MGVGAEAIEQSTAVDGNDVRGKRVERTMHMLKMMIDVRPEVPESLRLWFLTLG
jgi:hypothetical protein